MTMTHDLFYVKN